MKMTVFLVFKLASIRIRGCVPEQKTPNCMANRANGGYSKELKLKEFKRSKN